MPPPPFPLSFSTPSNNWIRTEEYSLWLYTLLSCFLQTFFSRNWTLLLPDTGQIFKVWVSWRRLKFNIHHPPTTVGVHTFGAGRLKVVSSEGTPANREDVARIVPTVVVKGSTPAIEGDQHLNTPQCTHGGWTDKVGVFSVHRFQLHAYMEGVLLWGGRLLLGSIERKEWGHVRKPACFSMLVSVHLFVAGKYSKTNQILWMFHINEFFSHRYYILFKKKQERKYKAHLAHKNVQVPCERCGRAPSRLHLMFSEGTWARRTHWDGNLKKTFAVINIPAVNRKQ